MAGSPVAATAAEAGMRLELSERQRELRAEARAFAAAEIAPHAARFDREEAFPRELVERLAARGYLASTLPPQHGGAGRDMIAYGLLTEEIGRACSSVRSLLTVHDMVAHTIERWGNAAQRARWLPAMARGEAVGALALTEPGAGSDAASIETAAVPAADPDGGWELTGRKRWISFSQIADLFLVFAKVGGQAAAFLLERGSPGLTIEPIRGIMGTRAAMLAELTLDRCPVPRGALVGRPGFGISHVASTALELGRLSVAWGSVAIGQASLDACRSYAAERRQFGAPLAQHQLVRAMLTDMTTEVRAGRLLCYRASWAKQQREPNAFMEIMLAKYFCSRMAVRAAGDAVQLHGAYGVSAEYPVGRYLRDAKVMEIIEGSTQIQQIAIAGFDFDEL